MKKNRLMQSSVTALVKLTGLMVVACCFVLIGYGQREKQEQRGFSSTGSYAIGDVETVNTQNGNVMFNFPLGSLPAGRGGSAGAAVNLMYNSKIWDPTAVEIPISCAEPGNDCRLWNTFYHVLMKQSDRGGWRYPLWHKLEVINKETETYKPYNVNTACYAGYWEGNRYDQYVIKVRMQMPDGSTVEFRPNSPNPYYNGQNGYHNRDTEGRVYSCTGANSMNPNSGSLTFTAPTYAPVTYFSSDGSHLKLDITFLAPDAEGGAYKRLWTLHYPNGSRVESSGPAIIEPEPSNAVYDRMNQPTERFYDRNGNLRTTENITYNDQPATQISDDLGRKIIIEYDLTTKQDYIHSTGVNGAQLKWTVKWKTIRVDKTYNSGAGSSGTRTLSQSIDVVDQIISPTQMASLPYTFGYNANADGTGAGWGEVSSVTLPSTAKTDYTYRYDGENNIESKQALTNDITQKQLIYQSKYDGASSQEAETWQYQINRPPGNSSNPYVNAAS